MTLKKKIALSTIASISVIVLIGAILGIVYGATLTAAYELVNIPYIKMDESKTRIVHQIKDQYLGHPDTVLTNDGTLFTMYPAGHGRGEIITQKSNDFGSNYENVSAAMPNTWEDSRETPTLYPINFNDGSQKLIMVSGKPSWGGLFKDFGFQSSVSNDNGATWSEFTLFYPEIDSIVAMASLIQLKENGVYVEKWMAVFHDYTYTNYSTILTFDSNGKEQFSQPQKFLSVHRQIEERTGMCELGITRDINSDTLILIARANNRVSGSMISFSTDEGNTWTEPKELPAELSGDRHKYAYDKVSGKLMITFRHLPYGKSPNVFSKRKTIGGSWVMWIGNYEDLISYKTDSPTTGDCLIELGHDYKGNSDTGYAGIVTKDGNVHTVSYGHFSKSVKFPYIMSVNFNLKDFLAANNL